MQNTNSFLVSQKVLWGYIWLLFERDEQIDLSKARLFLYLDFNYLVGVQGST